MNENLLKELFEKASVKSSKKYSYGTAGFRDKVTDEFSNIFPVVGLFAALRSISVNKSIGIMVTASHNPEDDNGVKIVDPDGGMLSQDWEIHGEALVNAKSFDQFQFAFNEIVSKYEIDLSKEVKVILGMDTRSHSPKLVSLLEEGINIFSTSHILRIGQCITPILHYCVFKYNESFSSTPFSDILAKQLKDHYFQQLLDGFDGLISTIPSQDLPTTPIIVDTAFGVGSLSIQEFFSYLSEKNRNSLPLWNIITVNTHLENGKINSKCGAEFVQKSQKVPEFNMSFDKVQNNLLCSFDGDGDRLVFHGYVKQENGESQWKLIDGDKIASLFSNFLLREFKIAQNISSSPNVKVGVVQTAYANGGSTNYLRSNDIEVVMAKTGVKYLHEKAHHTFDISVYFEANGHGTLTLTNSGWEFIHGLPNKNSEKYQSLSPREKIAVDRLQFFTHIINPTIGDAFSDLLGALCILVIDSFNLDSWVSLYSDLPSIQKKAYVKDKTLLKCNDDETRLISPTSLQDTIDSIVKKYPNGRAFLRPSGTEDVVRIYSEAKNQEDVDLIVSEIEQALTQFYNNI